MKSANILARGLRPHGADVDKPTGFIKLNLRRWWRRELVRWTRRELKDEERPYFNAQSVR